MVAFFRTTSLGMFNDFSGNSILLLYLASYHNLIMSANQVKFSIDRFLKLKINSRQMESSLIWFKGIDEKLTMFGSFKLSNRFLFLIIIGIFDNTIVLAQFELDSDVVSNFNVFEMS